MSISELRSRFIMFLSGFLFIFIVVYFLIVGPSNFLEEKIHLVINSIVVFVVMVAIAANVLITNKKTNIVDERDYTIQRKATSTGLLVTALYVFALSMILFISYRTIGFVNVSWMWFIAYSTFSFTYFITSFANFYLYLKEN